MLEEPQHNQTCSAVHIRLQFFQSDLSMMHHYLCLEVVHIHLHGYMLQHSVVVYDPIVMYMSMMTVCWLQVILVLTILSRSCTASDLRPSTSSHAVTHPTSADK